MKEIKVKQKKKIHSSSNRAAFIEKLTSLGVQKKLAMYLKCQNAFVLQAVFVKKNKNTSPLDKVSKHINQFHSQND